MFPRFCAQASLAQATPIRHASVLWNSRARRPLSAFPHSTAAVSRRQHLCLAQRLPTRRSVLLRQYYSGGAVAPVPSSCHRPRAPQAQRHPSQDSAATSLVHKPCPQQARSQPPPHGTVPVASTWKAIPKCPYTRIRWRALSEFHSQGNDCMCSMPAPAREGRQGAEAALVSRGTNSPTLTSEEYFPQQLTTLESAVHSLGNMLSCPPHSSRQWVPGLGDGSVGGLP